MLSWNCDACNATVSNREHWRMTLSSPLGGKYGDEGKGDPHIRVADLCPRCASAVEDILGSQIQVMPSRKVDTDTAEQATSLPPLLPRRLRSPW